MKSAGFAEKLVNLKLMPRLFGLNRFNPTRILNRLTYLTVFTLIFGALSCERPPELPTNPVITFESVRFATGVNFFDSLIITVGFEDGDGDLGLTGLASDSEPPYQLFNYFTNSAGEFIRFGDPEAPDEFHACDFDIFDIDADTRNDTIYAEINQNHYNIEVDLFVLRDGVYTEYDFRREGGRQFCETFDGRFPPLNSEEFERPLAGELEYAMVGSGWLPIFGNDTVQLRVRIRDRALNVSNWAESADFVIGQ